MGAGKIIALIGAFLSLLSVLLSIFLPEFFSWYSIKSSGFGITGEIYLTGFGTFIIKGAFPSTNEIWVLELIGGIFVTLGAILCIVGIVKKSKAAGIIGGIWILLGPIIFFVHILSNMNDFTGIVEALGVGTGVNVFWGSTSISGVSISWGLWIGFYIAIGGGILGLIGGVKI